MTITVSTLSSVDPERFSSLGFEDAAPFLADASDDFDSGVRRVVDSGHAWTGEGQPQAAAVMQINSIGFDVAALQMRAAKMAVDALATALTKAKTDLTTTIDTLRTEAAGEQKVIEVDDDGTVRVGTASTLYVAGGASSAPDAPPMIVDDVGTFQVQAILAYAGTADLTAAALLKRIRNSCPAFSANVSPTTLAYNTTMRDLARGNLVLAKLTEHIWDETSPGSWADEPTPWWTAFMKGAFGSLDPSGLPDMSNGFDFVELISDAPKFFGQRALAVLGGAWMLYDGLNATELEKRLPELDGPFNLLGVPPGVSDAELEDIVGDFTLDPDSPLGSAGFLTLAEAARLQAVDPSHSAGDEDYVANAEELRTRLRGWLAHSYDDLADGVVPKREQVEVPYGGSTTTSISVEVPHTLEHYDPEDFAISPEDRAAARQMLRQLDRALGDG